MNKLRVTSGASGPAFRLGSGFPAIRVNGGSPDMRDTYLTVEAIEATVVKFWTASYDDSVTRTIEVSTDGGQTWTSKTSSYAGTVLAELAAGEKVLLRGEEPNYGSNNDSNGQPYGCIVLDGGDAYLYGNIMSMAYGADFADKTAIVNEDQFSYLFGEEAAAEMKFDAQQGHLHNKDGAHLLLPATTLSPYCYSSMFFGCTGLTAAPELPATTLAKGCYESMFYGCTGLTAAPALPATTLVEACYLAMFGECTSLAEVTIYATSINVTRALQGWLQNVAAAGTFRAVQDVSYRSGADGIPSGWTRVNI